MQLIKRRALFEASKIVYLPVGEIKPNADLPRRRAEPGAMRELAASVEKYGVLQPLSVRRAGDGYELISGERRLRAAALVGIKEVPCIIMDVDTQESAVLALVENLQRRDLDFIEEARGLSRLVNIFGYNQEEAARLVGRSQPAVANKLRLLKLPKDILYLIKEAGLSERHARALLRLETDKDMAKILEEIVKNDLTVLKTDELIDAFLAGGTEQPEPEQSAEPLFVIKDVRLFLNTVARGVAMMQKAGIAVEYNQQDANEAILLTIKIPERGGDAEV